MDSRAGAVEEGESLSPGVERKVVCFWPYETSLWLECNYETRCRQTQKRKKATWFAWDAEPTAQGGHERVDIRREQEGEGGEKGEGEWQKTK